MLTCAGFYQFTYTEQADLLLQQGTFIQCRSEGNFFIDLYELEDLLIEIFYRKETEELVSIMAYNTMEKLKSMRISLQPRLTIKSSLPPLQKSNYAA